MQVKIISGNPETVETAATEWFQTNHQRVDRVLQSQSTATDGNIIISLTILFEEANLGTGLGFRRSNL